MIASAVDPSPPPFLRLAGHPLRWRLLSALARSDRRVRELTVLVGEPQSLVSYHLARLRGDGLVSARRSAADGRDSYYSVDLERCGEMLAAAGAALHPALGHAAATEATVRTRRPRVLFTCTGNSARSQVAEALTEHLSDHAVEAVSAGSHPKPLHRNAIRVMAERGIDLAGRRSKPLSEFAGARFDYVVSLCDRVREVCPEFGGDPEVIHWSVPNPAQDGESDGDTYQAFAQMTVDVETRVRFLLHLIEHTPTNPEVD